jgi:hypothetical protein
MSPRVVLLGLYLGSVAATGTFCILVKMHESWDIARESLTAFFAILCLVALFGRVTRLLPESSALMLAMPAGMVLASMSVDWLNLPARGVWVGCSALAIAVSSGIQFQRELAVAGS